MLALALLLNGRLKFVISFDEYISFNVTTSMISRF